MTHISRDPFARTSLHREVIHTRDDCWWCGQKRRGGTTDALFAYSTVSDGGRSNIHKGLFCSKSCHDNYHS